MRQVRSTSPTSRPGWQGAAQGILDDVGGALWRLGPGNPITDRTVSTASKRTRHFYIRLAYVGILLLLASTSFMQATGAGTGLAELAKLNSRTFALVSFAQLLMMCLLAPIFAAGAVSQQRDADTFNVLLTTPLTNGQIVLGTLCGRLFFVIALLISGLPVFLLTMLYGGVTLREIVLSFGLAAVAGLAMASLAITVGMYGVGTRQGVFSFYVLAGAYLAAGLALARFFPLAAAPVGSSQLGFDQMPVFAWAHPVLALIAVLGYTPAPSADTVAHLSWPLPFLLSRPAEGFLATGLVFSLVMIVVAMFGVRRPTRQGEPGWLAQVSDAILPAGLRRNGERRRRVRWVWHNPVAWREAVARASAPSQRGMRVALFVAGAGAALILLIYKHSQPSTPAMQSEMQSILLAALVIEAVVALVAATSAAGTAISRDRESGNLELMQTTPLTSSYIIAGKLRGLVTLTAPLLAVPTLTALLFILDGLLSGGGRKGMLISPASAVVIPMTLLTHVAAVAIIGLHVSLRHASTTKAVMISMGVVVGLYLPVAMAGWGAGPGWPVLTCLSPIMLIYGCVFPGEVVGGAIAGNAPGEMVYMLIIAAAGSGAVLLAVWRGYLSMIRNFDITLRRQT